MGIKQCPYCGEEIKGDAIKCRYCREWLSENSEAARNNQPSDLQPLSDIPKLKKQNFGIVVTFSVLLTLCILCIVGSVIFFAWKVAYDKNYKIPDIITLSYIIEFLLVLSLVYVLYALNKYMQNFGISTNFPKNIRIVQISIILAYLSYMLSPYTKIEAFAWIFIVAIIIGYVAFFLSGKCILNLKDKNNYNSGSTHALGMLMFYGLIFPPVWLAFPVFTLSLFNKARQCCKI
ncbi:zinc ribbon domain-containing protein [Dysgonomonas sp. OttesenSCG-928-M03]|nr:zinc ribbon domain-containing protein [Dysgonomonas sp. OttesenSCG-928-M03]